MRKLLAFLFRRLRPEPPEPEVGIDCPEGAAYVDCLPWERPRTDDPQNLSEEQIGHIHDKWTCPYCQSAYGLFEGPRGGASLNLFCGNPECDSRFYVIDPKFGRLPVGQFTGRCPSDFIEGRRAQLRHLH